MRSAGSLEAYDVGGRSVPFLSRRGKRAYAASLLALVAGAPVAAAQHVGAGNVAGDTFSDPVRIDNRWFPLTPGTQFILGGRANRGQGRLRHRVVFTVTDLTKVINGVRNLVLWDRDYNAGRLQEAEITFHAQDDEGKVWNFGEYPEEYKGGKFAGAPDTWIGGTAGARQGILMLADARVGTPSYLQGWAPAIEFADRARVYRTGRRNCVPLACYENVLVTDEWNPAEPGAHQRKYYAPGVGNIRVGAAGDDEEGETLVLVTVRHLSSGAMATVRRQALKLDARAYRTKPDVYGHTPPAKRMDPAA
jgi:hypothetical protein